MKHAIIQNGIVIQVEAKPRKGLVEVPDYVCPGYLQQEQSFIPPQPTTGDTWCTKCTDHIAAYFTDFQLSCIIILADHNKAKAADVTTWVHGLLSTPDTELTPPPHTYAEVLS